MGSTRSHDRLDRTALAALPTRLGPPARSIWAPTRPVDTERLEKLNPMAQRFFGRNVDMVYPARDGAVTLGVSQGVPSGWVGQTDIPLERFVDKNAPLAGEAGLDEAVRKGLLRRANVRDRDDWNLQKEKLMRDRLPRVAGRSSSSSREIHLDNAYVVLRQMTIPAGLYGAHSAVFFVPKGAPRPRGNPGHSSIHDFNDMSCTGPGCSE